jgi:Xaa-Pro dipeptidase
MGLGTLKVPMTMHAENREKLVAAMKSAGHERGIVLLQGGCQESRYDTDTELVFRQESYFNWLFGVKGPDWYSLIFHVA